MKFIVAALILSVVLLLGNVSYMNLNPIVETKWVATFSQKSDKRVMEWVMNKLFPNKFVVYDMPIIRRLSKRDIKHIYCGLTNDCPNEHTYIGLFDHQTVTVYVTDELPQCEANAVLAHEFTHFVQHFRDGSFGDVPPEKQEMDLALRELEADWFYEDYLNQFCRDSKP